MAETESIKKANAALPEGVMDFANLNPTEKSEAGVWMTMRHPVTNEDLGARLLVRGTESKAMRAAINKFNRISNDPKKPDVEKERAAVDMLSMAVIDMENVYHEGKLLEPTKENIRWFIETFVWIAAQVMEFFGDLENFLPGNNSY